MFNLDPKKMSGMMKKMGIEQEEIEANRVIIEQQGREIVIENPSVVRIKMQGQESFQISGDVKEEAGINEEDIRTIMEKTGKSREEAIRALEENKRDLAEAILSLSDL
jgi:nascent polypeptide-associated complex subunit alpha